MILYAFCTAPQIQKVVLECSWLVNWSIVRFTRPFAYASFRHFRFPWKIKVDQVYYFSSLVETTSASWDSNIIFLAEALAESTNSGPARRSKGETGGQSSIEFAIKCCPFVTCYSCLLAGFGRDFWIEWLNTGIPGMGYKVFTLHRKMLAAWIAVVIVLRRFV